MYAHVHYLYSVACYDGHQYRGHIDHHHNGCVGAVDEHWGWWEGPRACINYSSRAVVDSIGCYHLTQNKTVYRTYGAVSIKATLLHVCMYSAD